MKLAAGVIRENQKEILILWEEVVRKNIPASAATKPVVLLNILPLILEDLADILEAYQGRGEMIALEDTKKVIKENIGHGRHRTTSEHYTPKKL